MAMHEMCQNCDYECPECGHNIGFPGADLECDRFDCYAGFRWHDSCERMGCTGHEMPPPKDEDPIVPDDDRELYNIRVQLMDIKEILSIILDVQKDTVRELRIMSEHMTGMEHHDGKY